jgi:radical SAM protein with 4Fe4S-binding SPASM domain
MSLSAADRMRLLTIEARLREHAFPPQVVVENTSYCNLRCVHCCHKEMTRPPRHMERGLWEKIATEIGREHPDCEVWPTFYGEALILGRDGELWSRLDFAAAAGCRNLVLNSNGTLLRRWDNRDRILDSPLRRFILSLDGFTSATFESIRVGADRDAVYAAVEELLEEKRRRGRVYPAIICQLSRMPANTDEVEVFRAYWTERGAEVKVRPMLEWTASGSVRSAAIEHGSSFRIACPWANNTFAVHQNGDVVACAVDYDGRFKAGNLKEITIKEAWEILRWTIRELHRVHRWADLPELCRGCADWQAAGAQYEPEKVAGTRPFWAREAESRSAGR